MTKEEYFASFNKVSGMIIKLLRSENAKYNND